MWTSCISPTGWGQPNVSLADCYSLRLLCCHLQATSLYCHCAAQLCFSWVLTSWLGNLRPPAWWAPCSLCSCCSVGTITLTTSSFRCPSLCNCLMWTQASTRQRWTWPVVHLCCIVSGSHPGVIWPYCLGCVEDQVSRRAEKGIQHLIVQCGIVALFHGSMIFMYLQLVKSNSHKTGQVHSPVFHHHHPDAESLIYTIRNKDVKKSLRHIVFKNCCGSAGTRRQI